MPSSSITNGGDRFFYSITNDTAKGNAYLKLVNASSMPQPIQATLTGSSLASTGTMYTLSGNTLAETNTITDPKRIVPVRSSIRTGSSFTHIVPPYSIQVVVMESKK